MILGIPSRPGLRVMVASKPVDFRNYAERKIMQSVGLLTATCIGLSRSTAPHNS